MDFTHPLLFRLSGLLAGLGAVISLLASLVAGADIGTIIYRLFLFALLMAALGVGIFFVIQFFAPEIIEVLQTISAQAPSDLPDEENTVEPLDDMNANSEFFEEDPNVSSPYATESDMNSQLRTDLARMKKNVKPGEGEIVVEGVRLPNKPELMAEAIKDTLDRDREE